MLYSTASSRLTSYEGYARARRRASGAKSGNGPKVRI